MIRNVVFDMGGVLIRCNFDRYCERFVSDPADRALLMEELFASVEWIQMDRGVTDPETAAASVCSRLPERLHGFVHAILDCWHTEAEPMPGMEALVRRVKAAGYGVYLLSNTAKSFHGFAPKLPGYDCFDGLFASADWHLLKPEIAIYRAFCDEFRLSPSECVFIDDLNTNVEGAIHAGMHGVIFRNDVDRLSRELRALGVTV